MPNYSTKHFDRRARKFAITDQQLCEAMGRVRDGQADAVLGGGLFKQRISRTGEGRSGGFRVVFCLTNDSEAVFLTMFAKKQQDNLTDRELKAIKRLATMYRSLKTGDLATVHRTGGLREFVCEPEGGDDNAKD